MSCICSRMGDSVASLHRITSRLGWWLELPRTSTAIFGQNVQGNPRKLVRIRDFQVREVFPASASSAWT